MFFIFITLIAVLTFSLPWLAPRLAHRYGVSTYEAPLWLPILAGIIYLTVEFLPHIHISRETSTFQEHFFGGFYTALLYVYVTKLLGWRLPPIISLLGLFAWTSTLGTFNELFEFAVVKTHFISINITDTSWDLVANTIGSFIGYACALFIENDYDPPARN
jgi:hypothetical protein